MPRHTLSQVHPGALGHTLGKEHSLSQVHTPGAERTRPGPTLTPPCNLTSSVRPTERWLLPHARAAAAHAAPGVGRGAAPCMSRACGSVPQGWFHRFCRLSEEPDATRAAPPVQQVRCVLLTDG
eukprot:scaffold64039_cov17-Tisochrysis_lutea.AAC.1